MRGANAKVGPSIPLDPTQIKKVLVKPRQILITRIDGTKLVNSNPTPKESAFWLRYTVPQNNKQTRWDMASPDPLAMAALEEYDMPKLK